MIEMHFDNLPKDSIVEFLRQIADQDYISFYAPSAIRNHVEEMPGAIVGKLFRKACDTKSVDHEVYNLIHNVDRLPKDSIIEFLRKLAERNFYNSEANMIADNYYKLSKELLLQFLIELSDNPAVAFAVTRFISKNFYELGPKIRERLLIDFSRMNILWHRLRAGRRRI